MFCSHDLVINLPFYSSQSILLKVEICLFWRQESFSSGKLGRVITLTGQYFIISLNVLNWKMKSDHPESGHKKRFGWHGNPQLVHLFNRRWINKKLNSYKIDYSYFIFFFTVTNCLQWQLWCWCYKVFFCLLWSFNFSQTIGNCYKNFFKLQQFIIFKIVDWRRYNSSLLFSNN